MFKKADILKLTIIILITVILMATSAFSIYAAVAKPHFYTYFMDLGTKFLTEGNYEEAILLFEKAIIIERKSTDARIGIVKGSIELDDIETAVKTAKEAQMIDIEDKALLNELINILKDVDPEATYEIFMNYIEYNKGGPLDSDIEDMLNSSNEKPSIPEIIPVSGTYIKPFTMRLNSEKLRLGHVFYYTADGKMPNKNSNVFRGGIKIDKETTVKFIGCNPKGEETEVFSVEYKMNVGLENEIQNALNQAKKLLNDTEEGTEVGNCIAGAKNEFENAISSVEKLFMESIVSEESGFSMLNSLKNATETFTNNTIVPTDRTALGNKIEQGSNLLSGAVEGNNVGQYRSGAKAALSNALNEARTVMDNLVARQDAIDAATRNLSDAIDSFNAKKVTEVDKIIADAGAKIGPVTVSLIWNTDDDLDLHVTSPYGDTVNYSNKVGSSGGRLDVDRQVTTFVRNPVENIFWQNPPHGTYKVNVNVFSKRSSGNISFKVRTVVNGESKIYDMNVYGGMNNVCTFVY